MLNCKVNQKYSNLLLPLLDCTVIKLNKTSTFLSDNFFCMDSTSKFMQGVNYEILKNNYFL